MAKNQNKMEASQTLRRPSNWQDFETLCKKLWGEIWNCPEIKKNGRNGQDQHGIDIYGIPLDEIQYFGIQCKGKDEYTNSQFKVDEIVQEIENAKKFQPPLKKLYFATTAVKDAAIEEFVRKENLKNRSNGLFEVHLFSWEDIVDLIDENQQTHDWYVKSQKYKTDKSVTVSFQNSLKEIILTPQFIKSIRHFTQKIVPVDPFNDPLRAFVEQQKSFIHVAAINPSSMFKKEINLSYCQLNFEIRNTGIDPIEEFKLFFQFEGEIVDLAESNVYTNIMSAIPHYSNVSLWTGPMRGDVSPMKAILVGDDIFESDDFFLKPFPKDYDINVIWKLISKDFKDTGELKITIKSDISIVESENLVEDPMMVKTIVGEIEDAIFEIKE